MPTKRAMIRGARPATGQGHPQTLWLVDSRFYLKWEYFEPVARRIRQLKPVWQSDEAWNQAISGGNGSLENVLRCWGYQLQHDSYGNANGISADEVSMSDKTVFALMAGYVREGSYLEIRSNYDAGDWWFRWVFTDKGLKQTEPQVTWTKFKNLNKPKPNADPFGEDER